MKIIFNIIKGFFLTLGIAVFMLAGFGLWSFMQYEQADVKDTALPPHIVLHYDFDGMPKDAAPGPAWLAHFMPAEPTLRDLTETLYDAARDPTVDAFVARLTDGAHYDWASIQEFHAALNAFKQAGKKTYIYAETYGGGSSGMGAYYLASAFDQVWMQPMGVVAITGFQTESPYYKSVLDFVGVQSEVQQRKDFKTAPEGALRTHMSDAQRETTTRILTQDSKDFFEALSKGRGITPDAIGPLIDAAPFVGTDALQNKLIDRLGYLDELSDLLIHQQEKDTTGFVDLGAYIQARAPAPAVSDKPDTKPKVALIYIDGMIVSDMPKGAHDVLPQDVAVASDIVAVMGDAVDDDAVKAIVLRVNSPGGSPTASEAIRRAVERAKTKGKYVVVSMGSVAASGGYWVSVDADRIFALPGTLTGSIGVFGGKMNMQGLWEKLGVAWEGVSLGGNSRMWSPHVAYDAKGKEALGRMLDDIYLGFTERVAKGRNMLPAYAEAIAQGHVWTGAEAKANRLIDELGGLSAALDATAKHLGLADRRALNVVSMTGPEDPIADIMSLLGGYTGASVAALPAPYQSLIQTLWLAQYPQNSRVYLDPALSPLLWR